MAQRKRVTEKNPRTGALPAEQTAASIKELHPDNGGKSWVWQQDKLIFQLVENMVSYAGDQFSDNLKFNSEVLTNVLYDNLYKLLGDKFNEDEFIKWVVDELVIRGCVVKVEEPTKEEKEQEPKEEIVYELDDSAYKELAAKVDASIQLLKSNKITIFKLFNDIDNRIKDLSEIQQDGQKSGDEDQEIIERRDFEITELVNKIQSNQEKIDSYIESQFQTREQMGEKIQEVQKAMDESISRRKEVDKSNKVVGNGIKTTLTKISVHQKNDAIGQQLNKNPSFFQKLFGTGMKDNKGMKGQTKGLVNDGKNKKTQSILGKLFGKKNARQFTLKKKKPTLAQRFKGKIKGAYRSVRSKISKSIIGKTYRAVKKVIGAVVGAVKKVYQAVKKVYRAVKKTVKAVWRGAKAVVKGFVKASAFVGRSVRNVGKAIGRGVKKFINTVKKKGLAKTLLNEFNPAMLVVKFGWRALKFIGKKLWRGIKKLAFKAFAFFKSLFKLGGKFLNKVGIWMGKLGKGIKDSAYRFVIKPIASIMVTIFNFVTGLVMSPIKFIQWIVPTLTDKLLGALSNIGQTVKKVMKSTWGIFKKILFNPITIALLVGGLFLFFGPKLFGWLTGNITSIKDTIWPKIKWFAEKAMSFLGMVWNIITTVGGWIYKFVEYITNPDGWIVKTVIFIVQCVMAVKRWIKKLMKATGRDDIDILCMFLAGDMVGIAIHAIAGMCVKLWNWIKNSKLIRITLGVVKAVCKLYAMIWSLPVVLLESIYEAGKSLILSIFGGGGKGFGEAFAAPWKRWWGAVSSIFSGAKDDMEYEMKREVLEENPNERASAVAAKANIAVRSLKMKGAPEDNLKALEKMAEAEGFAVKGNLLSRIQKMNANYQENASQVTAYEDFIHDTWELGKATDDSAGEVLKQLLESPTLSQRLLSAFFYYNPQTGETQLMRPINAIGEFVKNIQDMVNDPDRENLEAFQTLIEAFDQINKERGHVVNQQGETITDFADRIAKFGNESEDKRETAQKELRDMVFKFNKGNIFDKIDIGGSYEQFQKGDAKTQDLDSVTGKKLGTNKLLKVTQSNQDLKFGQAAYKAPLVPRGKQENIIGNVLLPPKMMPAPVVKDQPVENGKSLREMWLENQQKRQELLDKNLSSDQVDSMGYKAMDFETYAQQYKEKNPPSEAQSLAERQNALKRVAAKRLARNVAAYHNQGKVASVDGFNLTKKPSILKVETNGLTQTMYMFSPEWVKIQGAAKVSDDELLAEVAGENSLAARRLKEAKEAEARKKAEEEKRRKREQQILDYSATVKNGFIEVKIGEDVQAMEDAWMLHQQKRQELLDKHVPSNKVDEMGFKAYDWESWKRYYRKMHGMPEDGIQRIPFEGKRKERQIDWSPRKALSVDELAKYGIQMSEEGPVMIPLDKAMAAASALLKGAKTIYSIRDGLEIMRKGLDTETQKLKTRREGGVPTAVIKPPEDASAPTTAPVPAEQQPEAS